MARRVILFLLCAGVLALGLQLALSDGGGAAGVAYAGTAGTISGNIRYAGSAPERAVIQMAADPFCVSAQAGQTVLTEQLIVNENDTLRWTFVHIREANGSLPSGDGETVVLNQVGCVYTPRVLGMEAGSTIRVTNSDQTLHNVNVQPRNNTAFNVAQPIPGMSTERTFANPEIMIPVRCDVHPWMQAYVGVVPHPFFDVTGEDGSFSMDGVPPGDYVLEAWHESLGIQTLDVTVRDGEAANVEFTFGGDR